MTKEDIKKGIVVYYARILRQVSRITHSYLQTLITKKNTWENIKSDMRLKCVKGKEYICMIGKWEEYLRYLENEIKKME